VVVMLACPIADLIVTSSSSLAASSEPYVWRRSCQRIEWTPATDWAGLAAAWRGAVKRPAGNDVAEHHLAEVREVCAV